MRRRRKLRHLERLLERRDYEGVAREAAAVRGGLPEVWQTKFDAVEAAALQKQGGIAPNDFEALNTAASEVLEIARGQTDRISSIQKRLGL